MTKDVTATVKLTVDTDITIEQVVTTLSLLLEDVEKRRRILSCRSS